MHEIKVIKSDRVRLPNGRKMSKLKLPNMPEHKAEHRRTFPISETFPTFINLEKFTSAEVSLKILLIRLGMIMQIIVVILKVEKSENLSPVYQMVNWW